jgi:hypothetical protein
MKCSLCHKEGHNKRSCKTSQIVSLSENNLSVKIALPIVSPKLKTEDTGKQFEMAICKAYKTPYIGKYKYNMILAEELSSRLSKFVNMFPNYIHTGSKGSPFDFTSSIDSNKHISAKTTKKGIGKVAPHTIGQCQPKKFCQILDIEYSTINELKKYIQTEILKILPILINHTFDCSNLYYNHEKKTIKHITLAKPIIWSEYQFEWTCNWTDWNNSSTLRLIKDTKNIISLVEFQFHSKSRTNMAIRWFYDNMISVFKDNMTIIMF